MSQSKVCLQIHAVCIDYLIVYVKFAWEVCGFLALISVMLAL